MKLLLTSMPIFFIALIGYLSARLHLFHKETSDTLGNLIFYFIMPITLFVDLANLPLHKVLNWPFLFSYFLTSICLVSISCITSRYAYQRKRSELVINAMAAVQVNTAYLALPFFLLLFNSIVPVASVIIVQAVFNFLIILSLDFFDKKMPDQSLQYKVLSVFWKAPILIAIILGLIASGFQYHLPMIINSTCLIIKQSAPFVALFTLGLSLGFGEVNFSRKEKSELLTLILFKSLLHPLIAFCIGHFAFHLKPFWLLSLVLMAAMPSAKNLFIFAKRYHVGENRANTIVLITTALSVGTINCVLFLLN